ncbi:Dihydroorotate dehydrogenase (quinone) mitochondrial [Bienertia sinuspersici]
MGMSQRISSSLPLFRRVISSNCNLQTTTLSSSHRTFTTSAPAKNFNVKGRLLTGATIGLVIAGGAYVSTVDEATFWYYF